MHVYNPRSFKRVLLMLYTSEVREAFVVIAEDKTSFFFENFNSGAGLPMASHETVTGSLGLTKYNSSTS